MTVFATHAAGEVIDAIRPDLEAFTSLWTALRVNYEGTNITRTVARLLHMYQPEEGLIAYERLLRTLFVLLEDFDSDGLRLLVSMVPPPKGVGDEFVKEVFNKATGFVRVDAPIFHKNIQSRCVVVNATTSSPTIETPYSRPAVQSCPSTASQKLAGVSAPDKLIPVEMKKSAINCTAKNDPCGGKINQTRMKSPQINSQEPVDVFRGFPPSEIHNTQNHLQSMKNLYRPQSNCGYAFPSSSGQSYVNFGQIIGQNSGRIRQPIAAGAGLPMPGYRPKWFQTPYLVTKNAYPAPQYHDLYLKTANNQYVKIPADKLHQENFRRADVAVSRDSYRQNLCNENTQNYLNSRSNTVTSGLLEKVQQRWRLGLEDSAAVNEPLNFPGRSEGDGSEPNVERGISKVENVISGGDSALLKRKLTKFIGVNNNNRSNENNSSVRGNFAVENINHDDNFEAPSTAANSRPLNEDNYEEKSTIFRNDDLTADNCFNVSVNREAFEEFAKEVRMRQRAIQEDIYKMDVVRCDASAEEETRRIGESDVNTIKAEILTASDELRTSCKGFLGRVKTDEIVEVPILPRTRSLSALNEERGAIKQPESNLWKLLTSKSENSGSNTPRDSRDSRSPDVSLKNPSTNDSIDVNNRSAKIQRDNEHFDTSVSVTSKRPVQRRKKPETLPHNQPRNAKTFTKDRILDLPDESANPGRRETQPTNPDTEARNNSQPVSARRCSQPFSDAQTVSCSSVNHQVTTMAELAAYKKQYYDALLSIQKAKAAVANSLAISSVGTPAGFDPYYYNYVQHHRHQMLHRHQRQMVVGHRFPQHHQSLAPSSPWFRAADWRYPLIEASRLPQRPQMIHPSSSQWPPRVGFLARDSQAASGVQRDLHLNVPQQLTKPNVKRRKLEEIVGKLKESETSGGN